MKDKEKEETFKEEVKNLPFYCLKHFFLNHQEQQQQKTQQHWDQWRN